MIHGLLGALYGFCHYNSAFLADVSAMFYQVRLHRDDRNAVQFLRRVGGNPHKIKFRENLPNYQKFRGPTQSGRSQGSQR